MSKRRESNPWNRCVICGRFISYADFESRKVRGTFTPDSDYSTEHTEFWHDKCDERAAKEGQAYADAGAKNVKRIMEEGR